MKILVLDGPNLNLLGIREESIYGSLTLDAIQKSLQAMVEDSTVDLEFFQSNHEGLLIDRIHQALHEGISGILCNPGAYTHTSVALRDAFLGTQIPFIEIHLTNVYARESFRHHSYFSDIAIGQIIGFGGQGYLLGLEAIIRYINLNKS